jgi:hypothetical protein
MTTTFAAAGAAILGWVAAVIVFGQSGTVLALPALGGWSISAVLGVDAARRHEHVPTLIAVGLVAAAAVFVGVAVTAI